MKILVTGAAGFIGSKVAYILSQRGDEVVGIDNINDYYDVHLKYGRLKYCGIDIQNNDLCSNKYTYSKKFPSYRFLRMSLENGDELKKIFSQEHFDVIVNLAAQAGVRYSIENPYSYIQSNICGFFNILENCRNYEVPYLVFASSSSVYGLNSKVPYSEDDNIGTPVSLYAASKRSDELMAHAYSKLYGFTTVGLRYFTVYGPWGRPDMAPFKFTRSIINNLPIDVYNNGDMLRDFTYIDDIVHGTLQLIDKKPDIKNCENMVPFRVYNIGCSHPIRLMDFISEIEQTVGKPAQKIFKPMQPGDVYQTYADTTRIEQEIGYKPNTSLHDGIRKFVDWFRSDNNPLRDE